MAESPLYPHGALSEVAPGTWTVTGTHNLPIHRNMAVHRLSSGGLLLHSAVRLDDPGLSALTALGRPEVMMVPHAKHSMDAAFYKRRFPNLVVVAPDDSKAEIEGRRKVKVDGSPAAVLPGHGLKATVIPGIKYTEYAVEVPATDGRWGLMVTDSLSHGKNREPDTLTAKMMRITGTPGGGLGVSRIFRWMMTSDRAALRSWIAAQAERNDLAFVWMAHGDAVTSDVQAELRRAVATV